MPCVDPSVLFDTFPFYSELDMLQLHLDHYKKIVSSTILVESPFTFSGKPKPLYFLQRHEQFKGYEIIWTKYTGKWTGDPWEREFGQRDKAMEAVRWKDDDFVLVNDVDEFVNIETLGRTIEGLKQLEDSAMPVCFIMDHYQGSFQCQLEEPWPGPVLIPIRVMKYNFHVYRDNRARLPLIQNGGWHFSYFGGVEQVQQKIEAYSHVEKNTLEINNKQRIIQALEQGSRII